MVFANYDQPYGPDGSKYGNKLNTQLIKFTPAFQMVEAWTLPRSLLDKFGAMSNSGGSWGPDGFLYLIGHDLGELYKMRLPTAGSVLELVATIPMNGTPAARADRASSTVSPTYHSFRFGWRS